MIDGVFRQYDGSFRGEDDDGAHLVTLQASDK